MRVIFALTIASLAAAAYANSPAGSAGTAAQSLDARVTRVEGKATVFLHGVHDEGSPVKEGMPLSEGDRVKTEAGAQVEIGIDGNSVAQIGPNTDLTLTSLKRTASAFTMAVGSFFAKIKHGLFGEGTFEVRTPDAVASVRGTEFAVEWIGKGPAHVAVFDEGKVLVRNPKFPAEVILLSNHETIVEPGRGPGAVLILTYFKGRRSLIQRLRERLAAISKDWKVLTPAERAAIRDRMLERAERMEERHENAERQRERREMHREK